MRSWKVLVGLLLITIGNSAMANNDTLIVVNKNDEQLEKDALSYLDSLNNARNVELSQLFFGYHAIEDATLDTAFNISEADLLERLNTLNNNTPLEISYNKRINSFIKLYAVRQRELTERILGLSTYYFPIIEEALDKYDMPLEIKYLAVVESALNPTARSRAGAVGLWQFMYWTGKANGLHTNSYIDERYDPVKSTEAACKYLTQLYNMYDDWNLALAAYNSGPGNVNKAIRRSGGKKDYWSIWPFLPRETRSYVPAFIAVNYIMNFAGEHGLKPIQPKLNFWERDTVVVNGPIELKKMAKALNMEENLICALNPSFKKDIIPNDGKKYVLALPSNKILDFLSIPDSVKHESQEKLVVVEQKNERMYHYVRRGEVLGSIARKYRCSVRQLMEWNNLRSSRIRVGQRLIVFGTKMTSKPTLVSSKAKPAANKPQEKKIVEPKKELPSDQKKYVYHTVKQGDTLWDIAKMYEGVTVNQIKQLNGSINVNRLKLGQKLKIKVAD